MITLLTDTSTEEDAGGSGSFFVNLQRMNHVMRALQNPKKGRSRDQANSTNIPKPRIPGNGQQMVIFRLICVAW